MMKTKENEDVTGAENQETIINEDVNNQANNQAIAPQETAEEVTPVPENISEQQTPPAESGLDQAKNIVLKYFPDADVSTPEAILIAAAPILIKMDAFNTWFNESLTDSQEAVNMLVDIKNGKSWQRAILENFNMDEINESPEGEEAIQVRKQKYKEKEEKMQKWSANEVETDKNFNSAADKLKIPEEKRPGIAQNIAMMFKDATDFLVTEDNFIKMIKGFIHDDVVAEKDKEIEDSFEDGRIHGRNEKIEKKRESMAANNTGLVSNLNGSAASTTPGKKQKLSVGLRNEFRV